MEQRFSPLPHRVCLMAGPVLVVLYGVGFVVLCKFAPVPNPAWPAERLVAWILDHKYSYELGCLFMLIGAGLLAPWGASHAVWTRKTEVRFPVMYITQLASLGASVAIFIMISIFWGLAAFRAGQISPEITQTIFDLGWFTFLWAGPAFYLWALSLGLGILWNPPEHQLFPRWSGWFTVAAVLSWSPGLIFVFWSYGPAAYNGPLPTWIALVDYGVWTVTMTAVGWRAISRQEALSRAERGEGLGVYPPPELDDPGDPDDSSDSGAEHTPERSGALSGASTNGRG
jgi:hypothetical protein